MAGNRFKVWRPLPQIFLGVVEHLTCLAGVLECWSCVAWDDRGVVEEVEYAPAVAGEHHLLLGALDRCSEMDIVCLLQLLACLDAAR